MYTCVHTCLDSQILNLCILAYICIYEYTLFTTDSHKQQIARALRSRASPHSRRGLHVCVAVCCSVLQCVAVCCSVLQCVAVFCSVCSVLQYVAVRCSVLQYVALCDIVLQQIARALGSSARRLIRRGLYVWCAVRHSVLQFVAVCSSMAQYIAECYRILQYVPV